MKFVRTGTLVMLSAAMLLSMVSCDTDGGSSSSNTASISTASDIKLTNKQVKFMAHWNMNPKEGDEKSPELQLFEEKYGGEIVDVPVTVYEELHENVMTAAMSDDCPVLGSAGAERLSKWAI